MPEFIGIGRSYKWTLEDLVPAPSCPDGTAPTPAPTPSFWAPFPNPPPRKQRKMDSCCRETLTFLRAIYTKLGL